MRYLLPFITGAITGMVFSFFKLPIPAPAVVEGIIGIVGIFVGYVLIQHIQ